MEEIFDLSKTNDTTLVNWSKIGKNEHGQWIWSLGQSSEIVFHTPEACKMLFIISAYTPAKNQKSQILLDGSYLANVDGSKINNIILYRNIKEGMHVFKVVSSEWNTKKTTTIDWSWSSDPIAVFFNKITIQCDTLPATNYSFGVLSLCIVLISFFIYWLSNSHKKIKMRTTAK